MGTEFTKGKASIVLKGKCKLKGQCLLTEQSLLKGPCLVKGLRLKKRQCLLGQCLLKVNICYSFFSKLGKLEEHSSELLFSGQAVTRDILILVYFLSTKRLRAFGYCPLPSFSVASLWT